MRNLCEHLDLPQTSRANHAKWHSTHNNNNKAKDTHLSGLRVSLTHSQRKDRLCQTTQRHDIYVVFESKTDLDKTRQSTGW